MAIQIQSTQTDTQQNGTDTRQSETFFSTDCIGCLKPKMDENGGNLMKTSRPIKRGFEKPKQLTLFPPDKFDTPTEKMKRAFKNRKNGSEIKRLYDGVCTGYASYGEAELALCCHLSRWLGDDETLINQVFRNSGLYRSKWNEKQGDQTYGQRTIAKGIAGQFHPPVPNKGEPRWNQS